jgi:hypothetical protein
MTKEALKLALEALEASHLLIHGSETKGGLAFCMDGYYSGCFDIDSNDKQTNEAITAIKEALAQPEQEPVGKLQEATAERAWFTIAELNAWADKKLSENPNWVMPKDEPERDESPPQRKPLTEDEVVKMDEWLFDQPFWRVLMLVRAIEAAHGIKGEA